MTNGPTFCINHKSWTSFTYAVRSDNTSIGLELWVKRPTTTKIYNLLRLLMSATIFICYFLILVFSTIMLQMDPIVISRGAAASPSPRAHKSHASVVTSARPHGPRWHSVFHYMLVSLTERHNPTALPYFLSISPWFIIYSTNPRKEIQLLHIYGDNVGGPWNGLRRTGEAF